MIIENSILENLKILLPFSIVALGGIIGLIAESFLSVNGKHKVLPHINIIFLLFAGFVLYIGGGAEFKDKWGLFAVDSFKYILEFTVLFCAFIGTAGLQNEMISKKFTGGEGYPLLMLSAAGIIAMVLSTDLLALFLGMELASFSIYALVGIHRHSEKGNEAAFKYFVSGALFSAIFLYGMSLFYGATGSTNFSGNIEVLQGRDALFQGGVFLLTLGLLFKVGAFPLHFWVADAYSGAIPAVTGYMASVVKIGAFVALGYLWIHIYNTFGGVFAKREVILFLALGLASIVVGAITGLSQKSARRILAFSAVSNAGFILFAFAYPYFLENADFNLGSAWYFLITYAIGSVGALVGISALTNGEFDDMKDLRGSAKESPFIGVCTTLCLASLAGLPITAGFLAKFNLFAGLVSASFNEPIIWGLAVFAFILAIISVAYYFKIIYFIWSVDAKSSVSYKKTPYLLFVSVALAALALLALSVKVPL